MFLDSDAVICNVQKFVRGAESHLFAIDWNIFYLVSGDVLIERNRFHISLYVTSFLALLAGVDELIHREPNRDHNHRTGCNEPKHLKCAHLNRIIAQFIFCEHILIDERLVITVRDFEERLENVFACVEFV